MALQHQANVLQSANELSPCVGQPLTSPAAVGSVGVAGGVPGSCVPGRWGGHGGAFLCLAGRCVCQIRGRVLVGVLRVGAEGGGTKRSGTCVVLGAVVVSPAAAQCASRSTAGDDIPRHNFIIN